MYQIKETNLVYTQIHNRIYRYRYRSSLTCAKAVDGLFFAKVAEPSAVIEGLKKVEFNDVVLNVEDVITQFGCAWLMSM